MDIAVVLPRNVNFGPNGATAIDLCAADFIRFSKFRSETGVFCHPVDEPFEGFKIRQVAQSTSHRRGGMAFAAALRSERPKLVIVHQHVQTAVLIARALKRDGIPVILHRHGLSKPPRSTFQRWREWIRYAVFARTLWPSHAARAPFAERQPALADRAHVISNGLDLTGWSPASNRDQIVLFVGRAHAEKGGLEAALGVSHALAQRPGWRTQFILSSTKERQARTAEIEAALTPLGVRARLEKDLPFEQVKAAFERAAIVLVPSICDEAFGRTALEAMAGGAALIHSGRGGLPEVVGEAGVVLPAVTSESIEAAVGALADEPNRRALLAEAGRKQCKQFEIRQSAMLLDSLYETVMSEVCN
jgi:glycosyltransferase involved in cell wall biosynthesis